MATSTALDILSLLDAQPAQVVPAAAARDPGFEEYYPEHWPSMPFHNGEVALQKVSGVHERVMSFAPRVIRPYFPAQHREFYSNQPFLVIAARDEHGDMWSTLLVNQDGDSKMTDSHTPTTLSLNAKPVPGDALENALHPSSDVGILGIEFATKRRNRVNGRIIKAGNGDDSPSLIFHVDQAFGNCPQYIQPRKWWTTATTTTKALPIRSTRLSPEQIQKIQTTQTIFVASGYRGTGEDVRFGNDASHRGGPAGFVQVLDPETIVLPEFAGNNHFNSLGNLLYDDRMGITIPDLENGGLLQITGKATVEHDSKRAAAFYPGALRLITFRITRVNQVPSGSLPILFSAAPEERALTVSKIVQESKDVRSFYMTVSPGEKPLHGFSAGQHLPIRLTTPDGEILRTYSLSSAASSSSPEYYRISVKKHEQGKASGFLHESVKPGDIIMAQPPAGDFVLEPETDSNNNKNGRPIVLLSAGIGVTPIFAMLQELLAEETSNDSRPIIWMHAAGDGDHHVFANDVDKLVGSGVAAGRVKKHIVYSRPLESDGSEAYDSSGRINISLIQSLMATGEWRDAEYYMCGPGSFLADIESGLVKAGVGSENVHYEIF